MVTFYLASPCSEVDVSPSILVLASQMFTPRRPNESFVWMDGWVLVTHAPNALHLHATRDARRAK